MEKIDIPQADKDTVSTRIDKTAHDILKRISVLRYGSESHMSSVLTDAVRFIHDPTPTQRVAKQKYTNNIEVYPRDPDCSDSKVIHWTAPSELAQEMRSLGTSNREFIESTVYQFEAYQDEMDENFSPESVDAEQVVDWDVMEDNYSISQDMADMKGADVPSKPDKRRPFIYSLIETATPSFDAFESFYEMAEELYDVSGLPSTTTTRRKDWKALTEEKHLIPTPSEKAERPIETVDSDRITYVTRRCIHDDSYLQDILEEYLEETERWITTKAEKDTTYKTTDAVFKRRQNTVSVIAGYEIQELEEYSEKAQELHNKMVEELVEFPD